MRTNNVIDDELMRKVLEVTGIKTKPESEGLKTLLQLKTEERVRSLRGMLTRELALSEMHGSRSQSRQSGRPNPTWLRT